MNIETALQLLTEAKHEIRSLRHRCEIQAAKLEVVEAFHLALKAPSYHGQPMSPDIAYAIDRFIEENQPKNVVASEEPTE